MRRSVGDVASFVVETYVPSADQERFAAEIDGIRDASAVVVVGDGIVHHVRSYLVPADEMGFHVLDAERIEDVTRVVGLAGIETERIVEAIGIRDRPERGERTRIE